MNTFTKGLTAVAVILGCLGSFCSDAQARGILRSPGLHPKYQLELEPYLGYGPAGPPGYEGGQGFGLGARASIPILHKGFLPELNDSFAVGGGLELMFYGSDGDPVGRCDNEVNAPNGTRVCTEVTGVSGDSMYFLLPVVAQWNFWIHRKVSAMVEPGIAIYLRQDSFGNYQGSLAGNFALGARWHFTKDLQAVLRLGYPTTSIGVSWFL